jgi:hypothetical protein
MIDILLNSDGDIDISNNQLHLTTDDSEAISQRLRIRLRFFYREWILDRSQGTKWFELVLIKGIDKYVADQEVRRRVEETPGIKTIIKWDSVLDERNRTYDITFSVQTDEGNELSFGFAELLNKI